MRVPKVSKNWRLIAPAPTPARADTDSYAWPPAIAVIRIGSIVAIAVIRIWPVVPVPVIRIAITVVSSSIVSPPVANLFNGCIALRLRR
jgi:hypothetical protein